MTAGTTDGNPDRRHALAAGVLCVCGCVAPRSVNGPCGAPPAGGAPHGPPGDIPAHTFDGVAGPVTVFAVRTGAVQLKCNFLTAAAPGPLAKVAVAADRRWAPPSPIYAWVVAHPEGTFVIDTGENAAAERPEYFAGAAPLDRWCSRTQYRFRVRPEDEIGPQLERLGLRPAAVRRVVLTHLHVDHTDGLKHFPGVEVLVHAGERRRPYHNLPHTYPGWFAPTTFDYRADVAPVFGRGFPVTAAEDIVVVPTPGHTPNHSSVPLRTRAADVLFAGDASYAQSQLFTGEVAASHADARLARRTYRVIREYARHRPTIYLPSHDPASGPRLAAAEPLPDLAG